MPRKKKTTIRDIAHKANVSPATVSFALSGKGRVSQKVKEDICRIAYELGYISKDHYLDHPVTGKRIGMLIQIDKEYGYLLRFVRPIIAEIDRMLFRNGHVLMLLPVEFHTPTDKVLQQIKKAKIDAIFSIHSVDIELFRKLEKSGIPVVILVNSDFQNEFITVCFDDVHAAYRATVYLLGLGHREFAYVEWQRRDLYGIIRDRFVGFRMALEEANVSFDERNKVSYEPKNPDQFEEAFGSIFARKKKPSAVFVHDDYLALKVIHTLNRLHLRVPEDISIIAHGDVLDYEVPLTPQITTMQINTELMGRYATDLMLLRMETIHRKGENIQVLRVNETLIERGSCRNVTKEKRRFS